MKITYRQLRAQYKQNLAKLRLSNTTMLPMVIFAVLLGGGVVGSILNEEQKGSVLAAHTEIVATGSSLGSNNSQVFVDFSTLASDAYVSSFETTVLMEKAGRSIQEMSLAQVQQVSALTGYSIKEDVLQANSSPSTVVQCWNTVMEEGTQAYWPNDCHGMPDSLVCNQGKVALNDAEKVRYQEWKTRLNKAVFPHCKVDSTKETLAGSSEGVNLALNSTQERNLVVSDQFRVATDVSSDLVKFGSIDIKKVSDTQQAILIKGTVTWPKDRRVQQILHNKLKLATIFATQANSPTVTKVNTTIYGVFATSPTQVVNLNDPRPVAEVSQPVVTPPVGGQIPTPSPDETKQLQDYVTATKGAIKQPTDTEQSQGYAFSWDHTSSGSNRLLVVFLSYGHTGEGIINSAVYFNGTAMTKVQQANYPYNLEVWVLKNQPQSGKVDVKLSPTAGARVLQATASSLSLANINQDQPVMAEAEGTGLAKSPGGAYRHVVAIPANPMDLVVGAYSSYTDGNTISAGEGTQELYKSTDGTTALFVGGKRNNQRSGSSSIQWMNTYEWWWSAAGIAIRPL